MMLLIVVDDEQPQNQQASHDAGNYFNNRMKVPKSSGEGDEKQSRGRQDVPPTLERFVSGVALCGLY